MFSEKSAYKKGNLTQKVLISIKFSLLIIGYLEIYRIFISELRCYLHNAKYPSPFIYPLESLVFIGGSEGER